MNPLVPFVMDAPAVISLTLLSKPSRPNISSALAAVQLGGEAARTQTLEKDEGWQNLLQLLSCVPVFPVNRALICEGWDAAVGRHVFGQKRDLGSHSEGTWRPV